MGCNPRGQYAGTNDAWISTCADGGWNFACPSCGTWYRPRETSKDHPTVHPFHHVWWFAAGSTPSRASGAAAGEIVFSAWGPTAEESMTLAMQEMWLKEVTEEWNDRPKVELMHEIIKLAKAHTLPVFFEDLHVTETAKSNVRWLNEQRKGGRKKQFSWNHLEGGFKGGFVRFDTDAAFMSATDSKRLWAMVLLHQKNVAES